MTDSNKGQYSLGIGDLLFVAFLVMKLAGIIDWSWWWVFSPLLIPLGLIGILFLFASFIKWAQRGSL